MPTTLDILTKLKEALVAIPLDTEQGGGPLFEAVELAANKNLAEQLRDLFITKARACLIVPLGIRRTVRDETGGLSVLGTKLLEVALLYSDRAYFKGGQAVTFGGEKNLGLLSFDEKIEDALTGRELTEFGGVVLGDSDPLLLSAADEKAVAGRHAWIVTALVPCGLIAAAVA